MLTAENIFRIIRVSSDLLDQDFEGNVLNYLKTSHHVYDNGDHHTFRRDLIEAANKLNIIFLEHNVPADQLEQIIKDSTIPVFLFEESETGLQPVLIYYKRGDYKMIRFEEDRMEEEEFDPDINWRTENGNIKISGIFAYRSLVQDENMEGKLTPLNRLMRLLGEEKRDIFYVYVYAVLIGLISLSLPLGIQATIGLISGGVFFSSVYVLIGLVILGIIAAGGLQVMQILLVEYLQRRVFTKAAFEFAFRVPRIRKEALQHYYAPELMNRFFDVLTLQKGLPKLLIDLSSGGIQILFGLILLSLYHPFFVFFSILLVGTLAVIFYNTGPRGLSSSIEESKYKYRVVYWLEELARTINSFKLSGNTPLPMKKTDYNVNNYLKYRKIHFGVLMKQYGYIIGFKALVTGGLLILGTILVVQREITLGQFVASEVIIILILNSVEKIIMYMDVVYDMLTAVDKIAQVTDLPLEKRGGLTVPKPKEMKGMSVYVRDLRYRFPGDMDYVLKDINMEVKSGERICISGKGGAGKSVLTNVIAGLLDAYEGIVSIDNYSLRDLDLTTLRDSIGKNVSQEDIFEGTILENILLDKSFATAEDALWAIDKVNIRDEIHRMPNGLGTVMLSGGKGQAKTLINKLILARCLAKRPRLLILNDYFKDFVKADRRKLIEMLVSSDNTWTLIVVSNDPYIMAMCDRVVWMDEGRITETGSFNELIKTDVLNEIIE